jgi:hypothetical protein
MNVSRETNRYFTVCSAGYSHTDIEMNYSELFVFGFVCQQHGWSEK